MTTETSVVEDRTVMLNGLRFHYRDWGNADAQALVCLHGFTGHARSWDTFAQAMRDGYHVLALDQRGHGETEWATDYHPTRRVEDMEAFVEALGLNRFVLLGLSMGGRCAFNYAARHPERVERLVIVDIAPEADARGAGRINQGLSARDVFGDPEEAVAAARQANPRPPESELRSRVLNNLMQRPDGTWTFRYDVALRNAAGARVMPTREEIDRDWASLANITSPTLLVRGAESDILSPEHAQRMVSSIPNCRLIEVQASGHSVPLDNPSGFIEAVRTFL
jgi:pimeloyl-ACP methyl ester carboxylesterase